MIFSVSEPSKFDWEMLAGLRISYIMVLGTCATVYLFYGLLVTGLFNVDFDY